MDGLEAAITQAEVEKALPKLSNGKATGRAGWPAALLRHAAYHVTLDNGRKVKVWMLAPILASFLNACFNQGRLPACVSSALVTPTHKMGPAGDPANYRPIAVGEPQYRLYTIVLNDRLVAWSEEHGLRSPDQAGFRPRQSPIHHLFALHHFIDRARLQQRPLFASFVNLQKAHDTVEHGLLWARLEGIGVGPKKVQQNGVRQGCPVSPTLFGIFFDGWHGHLDCSLLHDGLQLGSGRWVSALVYADDVVLLSWTAAGLQDLLYSMHAFCLSLGLTIGPSKRQVVVFNGSSSDTWHVGQHVSPSV